MLNRFINIQIVFSSDIRGFSKNSTVIASLIRRTSSPVHIKFYCQGLGPESFTISRLRVEFISANRVMSGNFPDHVGAAVFDRMQVIRDAKPWDRCLIMDHDMLALCDLAPYFEEDFAGNLLMGRLFGPGNTLGLQMKQRGGLPSSLGHTADYPYFYMGPMMNLSSMRTEGTWKNLLKAHAALGQEEQMALTIATEGRVKGVGRKWNLVPHWDNLADGPEGPERSAFGTVGDPAVWKNGVPQGIIHWTGPAKPWQRGSGVWRPDLWESEETSWEALRNGWWEKPVAALLEPRNRKEVANLARRGWKVHVFQRAGFPPPVEEASLTPATGSKPLPKEEKDEDICVDFPDVHFHTYASDEDSVAVMMRHMPEETAFLKIGRGTALWALLAAADKLPETLILQGSLSAREIRRVQARGYGWESRVKREEWSAGGPDPSVLTYAGSSKATALEGTEDVYLRRSVG